MKPIQFPENLVMAAFDYELPEQRIALFPLTTRDESKLLIWKNEELSEGKYIDLPDHLEQHCLLVFNDSRVIEARITFEKSSGGLIEIFCLKPHISYKNISDGMVQKGRVLWTCFIGGASKWKSGQLLVKQFGETKLQAAFIEKNAQDFTVEFTWTPADLSFAELLHQIGSVPLPPYIKRDVEISDSSRYQTIYARESGSVAAPTAGLHFSEKLLDKLAERHTESLYLTLHVGAGTFLPVKTEKVVEHHMHEEYIEVSGENLEHLIFRLHKTVVAVGTTSLRILESLYWLGCMVFENKNISEEELHLGQWYPYQHASSVSAEISLAALLEWTNRQPGQKLITRTQLFIVPGYNFRVVRGLITNFHQPKSTLLLLVAAFIGEAWKDVYTWALEHEYRFLSYGDGCLFLPEEKINE